MKRQHTNQVQYFSNDFSTGSFYNSSEPENACSHRYDVENGNNNSIAI